MILWVLQDSDNGKGDLLSRERVRTPLTRTSERAEDSRSELDLRGKQDCWARPQAAQSQGQSNSPGKGNVVKGKSRQRWRKERQIQRCWRTCLESVNWNSSCELGGRRVHRRRKQAQRLVRLTRLNAQRWICVQPPMAKQEVCESSLDSIQCGHRSWRTCVADERGLRMRESFR